MEKKFIKTLFFSLSHRLRRCQLPQRGSLKRRRGTFPQAGETLCLCKNRYDHVENLGKDQRHAHQPHPHAANHIAQAQGGGGQGQLAHLKELPPGDGGADAAAGGNLGRTAQPRGHPGAFSAQAALKIPPPIQTRRDAKQVLMMYQPKTSIRMGMVTKLPKMDRQAPVAAYFSSAP